MQTIENLIIAQCHCSIMEQFGIQVACIDLF